MEKALKTLAAVLFCATVLLIVNACTTNDMVGGNQFKYGFDQFDSESFDSVKEMTTIKSTFESTFKKELGVSITNDTFKYQGKDSNVKAACEKAVQSLNNKTYESTFTFIVWKMDAQGTSVFFSWSK